MARDKRQRSKTIPIGWALMSEASGDWLFLTSTVRGALDYYVNNWTKDGDPARESYDRADASTWPPVAHHMFMNDVEIVRVLGAKAEFSLCRGEDVRGELMKHAPTEEINGVRFLTDEEINDDPPDVISIINRFASTERP